MAIDWNSDYITDLIARVLNENAGVNVASAAAIAAANAAVSGRIIAEQDVVVAGLPLAAKVFAALDSRMQIAVLTQDGMLVDRGQEVLRLKGTLSAILTGRRTVLVFLEWLSGIATLTHSYVLQVARSRAKICCAQNTTPGLQILEQYATETGGGCDPNTGFAGALRITGSHVVAAGGVKAALDQAHAYAALRMRPQAMSAYEAAWSMPREGEANSLSIRIEVQNERELSEALGSGASWVILEKVTPAEARSFAAIARGKRPDCIVEVAGDIVLQNAREYAETGADFLTVTRLTQSASRARLRLLVDGIEET